LQFSNFSRPPSRLVEARLTSLRPLPITGRGFNFLGA